MADRVLVYDGALPQTTDILNSNLFAMIDAAYQNMSILGSSTVVAGLQCAPTIPATLNVTVGVGTIFSMDEIDATAYGDLGANTNSVMKMGINHAPVTLTITPPTTSGYSQVYLVEAIIQDIDSGATTLSYYNSSNPNQPWAGPSNDGESQYTERLCQCTIALKAGVAAPTGSQVTPSPDAGYTGLYTITVVNGQSTITSANIARLLSAPFFPTLPAIPMDVLNNSFVYVGTDTGSANAYAIQFGVGQPQPSAYTNGMGVKFKAANGNSGASTINVNGLGIVSIIRANGVALSSGDITSGQIVSLTYDGTRFQMDNYLGTGANTNSNTLIDIPYAADTGQQNALIANFSPAITAGEQVAGLAILVKLAFAITGPCTINVNGLGLKNVDLGNLTPTSSSDGLVAGEVLFMVYDGTQYQIISGGMPGTPGQNGAPGPVGPQGPPGTALVPPGGVGSINFAYTASPQAGQPQVAVLPYPYWAVWNWQYAQIYSGTWQVLSTINPNDIGGTFAGGAGFHSYGGYLSLVQRTA